jgi:acetyltransferase-like isoleucine patch superfamily enzyme
MDIGRNVSIGYGTMIWSPILSDIKIEHNVTIGNNNNLFSKGGLIVKSDSYLKDGIVVQGYNKLIIGRNSYIGRDMYIDCSKSVVIGNRVYVSFGKIFTHNFSDSAYVKGLPVSSSSVEIESNCWLGPETLVTPGTHVSEYTHSLPKSMLVGKTKSFTLYGGSPARPIDDLKKKFSKKEYSINIIKEINDLLIRRNDIVKVPITKNSEEHGLNYHHKFGNYNLLLFQSLTSKSLFSIINSFPVRQNFLIIVIDGIELDNSFKNQISKNQIIIFDVAAVTYFPLEFKRNSIPWIVKDQLKSLGLNLGRVL